MFLFVCFINEPSLMTGSYVHHTINPYHSFAIFQVLCVRKKLLNDFILIQIKKKVIWTNGEGEKYNQAASESVKVLKTVFFLFYRSCFYI